MKRILMLFLILLSVGLVMTACSDSDDTSGSDSGKQEEKKKKGSKDKAKDSEGGVRTFQIGETAEIMSASYRFPYELTVNSVELVKDEFAGHSISEYYMSDVPDDARFFVVNVTLKNIQKKAYAPYDHIMPQLYQEMDGHDFSEEEFTPKWREELEPGGEVTTNLVFLGSRLESADSAFLKMESMDVDRETLFELPIPKE